MINVVNVISRQKAGGAELLVRELHKIYLSQNINAHAIYFAGSGESLGENEFVLGRGIRSPLNIFRIRKILRKILNQSSGDLIVHVHLTWPFLYSTFAVLGLSRVKLVYTEHSTTNKRRNIPLLWIFERLLYRRFSRIICISLGVEKALANWVGNEVSRRMVTIPNGSRIYSLCERTELEGRLPRLVSVGSLSSKKNFATAISAIAQLKSEIDSYTIIGEGPDRQRLEKVVKNEGMEDKVKLVGWSDAIEKYLHAADIQIIPSRWEGFGLVAVEGMSTGLPVVASNVDGLCEVLDESNPSVTLVNRVESVGDWVVAIREALSDLRVQDAKNLAQASRKQAEKFTLEKMAEQYMGVYLEISLPNFMLSEGGPRSQSLSSSAREVAPGPSDKQLVDRCTSYRAESIVVTAGYARSLINFRGPLIKALCDSGLEVHAIAPGLNDDQATQAQLEAWGVITHEVPIQRTGTNPLRDLSILRSLYLLFREIKPDVVLGYTIKPVIYGTLAAWLARVPKRYVLITGLGYAFSNQAKGKRAIVLSVVRRLYRLAIYRAHLVMFQNPDDQALFRSLSILPSHVPSTVVNGSGVDVKHFEQAPLLDAPVSFLLTARLIADKGVRLYAEAAKKIKSKHPDVTFFLVGDLDNNPESIKREELDDWIGSGDIDYLGMLNDVRSALANTHVFVLPTYYREGVPRTILEALAIGRAIITTEMPGCRETVAEGENGFLVPVKSVDALVVAMQRFIDQPELVVSMGRRSRAIAEEKYDVHKVNAVMLEAMGIAYPTDSDATASAEGKPARPSKAVVNS